MCRGERDVKYNEMVILNPNSVFASLNAPLSPLHVWVNHGQRSAEPVRTLTLMAFAVDGERDSSHVLFDRLLAGVPAAIAPVSGACQRNVIEVGVRVLFVLVVMKSKYAFPIYWSYMLSRRNF